MNDDILKNDNILVIDDSGFFVRAYSKVLSEAGYPVLIACDGQSGISTATACHPSLIILDLLLPGMSGIDVLQQLKGNPSTCDIPVIVVSSLSDNNATKVILEGAVAFCGKETVTAEVLEKAVNDVLRRRVLQPGGVIHPNVN